MSESLVTLDQVDAFAKSNYSKYTEEAKLAADWKADLEHASRYGIEGRLTFASLKYTRHAQAAALLAKAAITDFERPGRPAQYYELASMDYADKITAH